MPPLSRWPPAVPRTGSRSPLSTTTRPSPVGVIVPVVESLDQRGLLVALIPEAGPNARLGLSSAISRGGPADVATLDIPVRQVLIESRIVIANDDFARELGVRFGASTIGTVGNNTIGQSGSNSGSRTVVGGGSPGTNDNYIVNLPTALAPAGRRIRYGA